MHHQKKMVIESETGIFCLWSTLKRILTNSQPRLSVTLREVESVDDNSAVLTNHSRVVPQGLSLSRQLQKRTAVLSSSLLYTNSNLHDYSRSEIADCTSTCSCHGNTPQFSMYITYTYVSLCLYYYVSL